MTIQGHPPFFLKPQPRFVTMRGGEYLFRPSMSGLRWLAALSRHDRSGRLGGLGSGPARARRRPLASDHSLIFALRPRTSNSPTSTRSSAGCFSAARVESET